MEYFNIELNTNLEVRPIERDGDMDLFIPTLDYPIHLEGMGDDFSRIQFPTARAILIRMSPKVNTITCHVLKDVDLFSSFVNFEVRKELNSIVIYQREGYIELSFK
ncbi:MAG: hypothetical protein K0S30_450 [Clostridia bacterium]|jgi:hypothetical protein|nr:hypothetical protein [Clostridia bacterium]